MENLYSTEKFQKINEIDGLLPFNFILNDGDKVQSEIHGVSNENKATYGIYAPFWMPEITLKRSDINQLDVFVLNLISLHKEEKNISIEIRLPPSFYSTSLDILKFILLKHGFKLSNIALWQTLKIKGFESKLSYENSLKYSSRKELKNFSKLYQFNLREIDITDKSAIKASYQIIDLNRRNLGVCLKYSLNYLFNLIVIEPNRIKIFDLIVEDRHIASAICHETQDDILYVAAWGDANHHLNKSPMYIFGSELTEYCIQNKYSYLDFGISSDLRQYTPNLYRFKENIGCFASLQETFYLDLLRL
jgi:hypothetical protein